MSIIQRFSNRKAKRDVSETVMRHAVWPAANQHGLWWGLGLGGLLLGLMLHFNGSYIIHYPDYSGIPNLLRIMQVLGVLIGVLALGLFLLGRYWQPTSRRQQAAAGAIMGSTFGLILFVLGHYTLAPGVEHIFFSPNSCNLPKGDLYQEMAHALNPTLIGYPLSGLAFVALLALIGCGLARLLTRLADEPTKRMPVRDAFTPLLLAVIPVTLLAAFLLQPMSTGTLEWIDEFKDIVAEYQIQPPHHGLLIVGVVLPLLLILLSQIMGIARVWRWQPGQVHGGMLRVSQILMGLVLGVLIIPLFMRPSPLIAWWPVQILTLFIVVLAWGYVLTVQRHFRAYRTCDIPRPQVRRRDLATVVGGNIVIAVFMLNLFTFQPILGLVELSSHGWCGGAF